MVATSPNAEVYLDGELRGRADTQGELKIKSKLGVHALKVTLGGKKDFKQSVTLGDVQTSNIEAMLQVQPGPTRENPKDGLMYVWIPPDTFIMGCSPGDTECQPDEKPPHQVIITTGFWLGQTEVTVGAYKRFAAATRRRMPTEANFDGRPLNPRWDNEAMPIVNVIWDDARAYCSWAGGWLPSESEWEYAARAGSTSARYGELDDIAWDADNSGRERVDSDRIFMEDKAQIRKRFNENGNGMHEVGQKRANGFGLYDMLGNVWEWVSDAYSFYPAFPLQDTPGPEPQDYDSRTGHVKRGGSWANAPVTVRVSYRDHEYDLAYWDYTVGFRCGAGAFAP